MAELYRLASSALPDDAVVLVFRGREEIGRPYEFEVFFTTRKPGELELDDAIGAKATFAVTLQGEEPYEWHGVLRAVEHLHEMEEVALCRAVLVPQLWQLTQTRHSNIFTKLTIPQIIEKVLIDGGLSGDDFEFRLDHSYDVEEHVCQYHESHLDFIHRWMEMEGIYYFFDHSGDQEKIIFTDSRSFHENSTSKPIRYFPLAAGDSTATGNILSVFTCLRNALPGSVALRDYDYGNPALEMSGRADVSRTGVGEINIYGNRFFTPSEGKRLAGIRAEELLAQERVFHGEGRALFVRSGYLFAVDEHPRDMFNKEFLATRVEHVGAGSVAEATNGPLLRHVRFEMPEPNTYRLSVSSILKDTQYRQPRTTHWPRIYGYENAVVDGAAMSQYAQIDEHGRYAIKFHFDESDLKDGKASTWVRMAQPHGGGTEGFHFPLRKGTEVICAFLGGDPDRPVIVAVVPNAQTPSPIIDANHTRNMIRTGSGNHITIEDSQGKEFIHLCTPKYTELFLGGPTCGDDNETQPYTFQTPTEDNSAMASASDVSCTFYLYTDQTAGVVVDGDYRQMTGGDILTVGGGKLLENYVGPHVFTLAGKATHFLNDQLYTEIATGRHELIKAGGDLQQITGFWTQEVDGDSSQTITGNYTHTVTEHTNETYKQHTTTVAEATTMNHNGGYTQTVTGGNCTISVPDNEYSCTANGVSVSNLAKHNEFTIGSWFKAELSGKVEMTAGLTSSTYVGLKNDNFIGGNISLYGGVSIKLGAGFDLTMSTISGQTFMLNNEAIMTKLTAGSYWIEGKAMAVLARGLTVM